MYNINDIADYIIFRMTLEDEIGVANLKLQKLMYYVQAWHLAFNGKPLFDGKFQAWIHGPVNRELYDRFKDTKSIYAPIAVADIKDNQIDSHLTQEAKTHIDIILDSYAGFSGTELELMTHKEEPWSKAREGYSPMQRCEENINEDLMRDYYKARLQ